MEGSFIKKIKKVFNKKKDYPHIDDYTFSGEELDLLSEQNKEEIKKLRKGYKKVTKVVVPPEKEEVVENIKVEDNTIDNKDIEIEVTDKEEVSGYINLSSERRENIMKRWNSIDVVSLEKDIDEGKDILDHNYIITYADDSLSYIYKIRSEYDILIEYLIGFNNEKKGIYEKNIFSSKLEDEWKFLNSYIKILEKIRGAIDR